MPREKIEPGLYTLVCLKAQLKHAKASGDRYISVECKVQGRDAKVWETIMLEGKGKGMGVGKLAGWGFKPGIEPDPMQFIDRETQAHLKYEEWQGEQWLKVDSRANKTGGYILPQYEGDEPPHKAFHGNPDKPSGRPATRLVKPPPPEDDPDLTPF
jgi:hypothetical protein